MIQRLESTTSICTLIKRSTIAASPQLVNIVQMLNIQQGTAAYTLATCRAAVTQAAGSGGS